MVHIGSLHQHYSDKPPHRRTQLRIAKITPRTPPRITWKFIWRLS